MTRGLLAGTLLLGACGGPATPVVVPSPPAAVPVAASCTLAPTVPGGATISALHVGEALHHPALYIDGDRAADFGPAFPALVDGGGRVDAVAPIQVDADADAELAVLFEQGPLQPEGESRVVRLAVYDCAGGALTLVPEIIDSVAEAQQVQIMGAQAVARPGGPPVTSISILAAYQAMEVSMFEIVVGAGTAAWPVPYASGDQGVSVVGKLGAVDTGRQVLVDGSSLDYYRTDALQGSGWWPAGDDQVFVSLRRDQDSESDGRHAQPEVLARMTAAGIVAEDNGLPAWALAGDGPMPAWCAALGCRAIPADSHTPFVGVTWIAGVWSSAGEARAAMAAAGSAGDVGQWLYLGSFEPDAAPDDGGLPLGPGGKAPLTELTLVDGV